MKHINGKTQLVGIIGWPVEHSFSPAMHNAAFAAAGLNWAYAPLPVKAEDVATAVAALPILGFRGVNVTVPHKQAVMPHLDALDPGAHAIGAVNTLIFHNRKSKIVNPKSVGYNTDWSGFLADLEALDVAAAGRDCLVLGAGGSARAVVYALAQAGGRVRVLARRPLQAQRLVDDLQPHLPQAQLQAGDLARLGEAATAVTAPLIINTTPLGMAPHAASSAWPADLPFPPGAFAYDLVYNPGVTRFMRQAQAAGCRAANGLGMLLHQGAQAFKLWTGQEPDLAVMQATLGLN
jgi:shikimate dehydrogenase